MVKATNKFVLRVGKLSLPLATFKAVDTTTSVYASEVTKYNGKIYKVQRKPYIILENGTQQDIDSTQILKQYEKDDGSVALFSKEEQSQLLKRGSSPEWIADTIVPITQFNEFSFQKEPMVAMIDLIKKKELINLKNLKFFKMLQEGLGNDKALVTQILYKNTEFPVAISNFNDKFLIRFLNYKENVREIEGHQLPELTEQEKEQAITFTAQFLKPDFDLGQFENKTEEKIMTIINSKGTEVTEINPETLIEMEDNPFI